MTFRDIDAATDRQLPKDIVRLIADYGKVYRASFASDDVCLLTPDGEQVQTKLRLRAARDGDVVTLQYASFQFDWPEAAKSSPFVTTAPAAVPLAFRPHFNATSVICTSNEGKSSGFWQVLGDGSMGFLTVPMPSRGNIVFGTACSYTVL